MRAQPPPDLVATQRAEENAYAREIREQQDMEFARALEQDRVEVSIVVGSVLQLLAHVDATVPVLVLVTVCDCDCDCLTLSLFARTTAIGIAHPHVMCLFSQQQRREEERLREAEEQAERQRVLEEKRHKVRVPIASAFRTRYSTCLPWQICCLSITSPQTPIETHTHTHTHKTHTQNTHTHTHTHT
jgi:hypothetical protein